MPLSASPSLTLCFSWQHIANTLAIHWQHIGNSPLSNSLFLCPSLLFSLGFLRAHTHAHRSLSHSHSHSLSFSSSFSRVRSSLSFLSLSLSFSKRVHVLGLCPSNRCSSLQHISNTLAPHWQQFSNTLATQWCTYWACVRATAAALHSLPPLATLPLTQKLQIRCH